MIETSELIDALVADARPVQRLAAPSLRAARWLLLPVLIFGLLALGHGVRPDLSQRLLQPEFVVGIAASLLTGVLAALASFQLDLPDRSRAWALLPVPTLVLWVGTIGHGCLTNWVDIVPGGMQIGETARCFATVLLTSLPLSVVMFAMLRHAARLGAASRATLSGSVAVAAMSASAMMLFHRLDASAMVLVWNLGVAAVIVALGAPLGRRLISLRQW